MSALKPERGTVSQEKRSALLAGQSKYEGAPCRTCGGVIRYVSTSHCVACHCSRQPIKRESRTVRIPRDLAKRLIQDAGQANTPAVLELIELLGVRA